MMKLQEEGKINIQDPVAKYIPGFPNGNNLKLYHFLTHTSGISPLHWHRGDTTPLSLFKRLRGPQLNFNLARDGII